MRLFSIIIAAVALVAAAVFAAWRAGMLDRAELLESPAPRHSDDGLIHAWHRVQEAPKDPYAWLALGDAQSSWEQLVAAEHSYRTALRVLGTAADGSEVYARLGFALYARGEDDDARVYLLEAKRRGSKEAMLDFTLDALSRREAPTRDEPQPAQAREPQPAEEVNVELPDGGVAVDSGTSLPLVITPPQAAVAENRGTCTVPVERISERSGFLATVVIQGVEAKLIVDTGASISVITSDLMRRMGAVPEDSMVRVITANGPTSFGMTRVSSVELGDRSLEQTLLAVCEDCVQGVSDGLLGLDLQAAFSLELELRASRLRFADCTE